MLNLATVFSLLAENAVPDRVTVFCAEFLLCDSLRYLMDISTDSVVDFVLDESMAEPRHSEQQETDHRRHGEAARNGNTITTVIMADASLVPPAFNGASGTDADAWIRKFINYCEFRHLTGDDRLPLLKLLLVDAASDWVQGLPVGIAENFDHVLESFRDKFVTNAAAKIANLHEFWNRKQQEGQSAEDFINATRRLAAKIPVTDNAVICHAAVNGLRDDVKRFVVLKGAESLDELVTAARLAEAAALHVPDTGDKTMAKDIQDLKAMFIKLVAGSSSCSNQPTVGNVAPTATATTARGPATLNGTTQQVRVRDNGRRFRGRGRGFRDGRPQWQPRWAPYDHQPGAYQYIPTYSQSTFAVPQQQQQQQSVQNGTSTATNGLHCCNCGRIHVNNSCFARSAICFQCGVVGHFARCCAMVNSQ